MKDKTLHYTEEQLNMLLDGRMLRAEELAVRSHLLICNECRSSFNNLVQVDGALRELPVPGTRPGFTQTVMARVLAPAKSPLAFLLLEKVSYVFGLMIVLGLMIAAFVATGVFNKSQIDETTNVASGIVDSVGQSLAASVDRFTALLVQYLPFAFGKGSMGLAFFLGAVVVMLAAVDRLVGKKVLER